MADSVRVVFLGGLGEIGRNCMAIEQRATGVLLIDCGLMFPDADMHGIDLVLPDFTWLRENARSHRGLSSPRTATRTTSAALQYLLARAELPDLRLGGRRSASPATASRKPGCSGTTELIVVTDGERRMIGPFDVEFIPVTHSVPHAHAIALHTPQGVILHSGDFKLDLTPVDGRRTDLARIGAIASTEGIRLLLADSTNAEEHGSRAERDQSSVRCCARCSPSSAAGGSSPPASPATSTASSRSPTPQSPTGRVVATLGLSMKKNVRHGSRSRGPHDPRRVADRHRGHRRLPARQGLRDLHRLAG